MREIIKNLTTYNKYFNIKKNYIEIKFLCCIKFILRINFSSKFYFIILSLFIMHNNNLVQIFIVLLTSVNFKITEMCFSPKSSDPSIWVLVVAASITSKRRPRFSNRLLYEMLRYPSWLVLVEDTVHESYFRRTATCFSLCWAVLLKQTTTINYLIKRLADLATRCCGKIYRHV